jgi:threonine dehydrogenase-like Zn-dependent dehydrogenase
MRSVVFAGVREVRIAERPDSELREPGDVIVRVVATCVCGSDLWYYRGESPWQIDQPLGHEFIGVVAAVGSGVGSLRVGDAVIAPFRWSCGECTPCLNGVTPSCERGGMWGHPGSDSGQGERVRVPFADATLVRIPVPLLDDRIADWLALTDVFCTGHHAAVSAGVSAGAVVAVVGDGAVGISAVAAARRLGAERIIAFSSHPARQSLVALAGADDIVAARGEEAAARVMELTGGRGVDAALECVGTASAMTTAFDAVRPGGSIGFVGAPHGNDLPIARMFLHNIRVAGGLAPVRKYLDELVPEVAHGALRPGIVFDREVDFDRIPDGYRAMDAREALKVMSVL